MQYFFNGEKKGRKIMRKKTKTLLSLLLSVIMMVSMIPSVTMAQEATSILKDKMDWKSWCPVENASVLEGMVYNIGAFGKENVWKG